MSKPEKIDLDFFKTQFEEQSHLDLEWNTPPDFIFEDAISTVNTMKSNESKKRTFLYITIGILSLILLSLAYSHNKVASLEDKVNLLTTSNSVSQVTKDADITDNTQSSLTSNSSSTLVNDIAQSVANSTETSELKSSNNNNLSVGVNTSTPTVVNKVETNISESPAFIEKQVTNNFKAQNTSNFDIANEVKAIEKQSDNIIQNKIAATVTPVQSNSVQNQITPIGIITNDIKDITIEKRAQIEVPNTIQYNEVIPKPKAEFSFDLVRNISTIKVSEGLDMSNTLSGNDSYYGGTGLQVGLKLPVSSRVSWVNSASYDIIHNESFSQITNNYSKGNEEVVSTGETMYRSAMTVESPMGTIVSDLEFEVDPNFTNEGDIVYDNVYIDQTLKSFSLSTGLQYAIIDNNNFRWNGGINIGGSYVSSMTTNLDSKTIMHNTVMDDSNRTFENAGSLNRFLGYAELTSDINYKIGKKYNLNLGLGYSKGLTSLRSVANGGPSTYLSSWSTSIGISRSF